MKLLKIEALRPYLSLSLILSLYQAYAHEHTSLNVLSTREDNVKVSSVDPTKIELQEQLADKVCAIILAHSLTRDIDAEGSHILVPSKDQLGYAQLRQKVLNFVSHSQPIIFTLIGFPFKSGNKEKNVIGALPDQAERIALENMQRFMERINQVYPHGASLRIYTDGLGLCDLLGVPIEDVQRYEETLKRLAEDLPLLSIITLQDLFPELSPLKIQKYIKDQKIPLKDLSTLERDSLSKRLLQELDYPQGKAILEKISVGSLAQKMSQRSKKLSQIYKSKFPPSINLTVHFQKDIGTKVGIALSPSSITPWHGVAVLNKDGSFSIERKKDLPNSLKLTSKTINDIECHYYTETK